jgi:hypothetical protein
MWASIHATTIAVRRAEPLSKLPDIGGGYGCRSGKKKSTGPSRKLSEGEDLGRNCPSSKNPEDEELGNLLQGRAERHNETPEAVGGK